MKVYLAGPINGCGDGEAHDWRNSLIAQRPDVAFLNPMLRDYRGREDQNVNEIVEADKADIDPCDVVIAYCWQVSWGTAMEIFYAYDRGLRVIAVVPAGHRISPWLRYHTDAVVSTLDQALSEL